MRGLWSCLLGPGGLCTSAPRIPDPYTKPSALYGTASSDKVDLKRLKRLIVEGKLAPFFPGLDDCSPSAAPAEQRTLVRKLLKQKGQPVLSSAEPPPLEECPICFMYYPLMNTSRCCAKRVCTDCFLQVQVTAPSHTLPTCPFCKVPGFTARFLGAITEEAREQDRIEEQKVIEARIREREEEVRRDLEREQQRAQERLAQQAATASAATAGTVTGIPVSAAAVTLPAADGAIGQIRAVTSAGIQSQLYAGPQIPSTRSGAYRPSTTESTVGSGIDGSGAVSARAGSRAASSIASGEQQGGGDVDGGWRNRMTDYVPTSVTDISISVEDINDFMLEQAIYESLLQSGATASELERVQPVRHRGRPQPPPRQQQQQQQAPLMTTSNATAIRNRTMEAAARRAQVTAATEAAAAMVAARANGAAGRAARATGLHQQQQQQHAPAGSEDGFELALDYFRTGARPVAEGTAASARTGFNHSTSSGVGPDGAALTGTGTARGVGIVLPPVRGRVGSSGNSAAPPVATAAMTTALAAAAEVAVRAAQEVVTAAGASNAAAMPSERQGTELVGLSADGQGTLRRSESTNHNRASALEGSGAEVSQAAAMAGRSAPAASGSGAVSGASLAAGMTTGRPPTPAHGALVEPANSTPTPAVHVVQGQGNADLRRGRAEGGLRSMCGTLPTEEGAVEDNNGGCHGNKAEANDGQAVDKAVSSSSRATADTRKSVMSIVTADGSSSAAAALTPAPAPVHGTGDSEQTSVGQEHGQERQQEQEESQGHAQPSWQEPQGWSSHQQQQQQHAHGRQPVGYVQEEEELLSIQGASGGKGPEGAAPTGVASQENVGHMRCAVERSQDDGPELINGAAADTAAGAVIAVTPAAAGMTHAATAAAGPAERAELSAGTPPVTPALEAQTGQARTGSPGLTSASVAALAALESSRSGQVSSRTATILPAASTSQQSRVPRRAAPPPPITTMAAPAPGMSSAGGMPSPHSTLFAGTSRAPDTLDLPPAYPKLPSPRLAMSADPAVVASGSSGQPGANEPSSGKQEQALGAQVSTLPPAVSSMAPSSPRGAGQSQAAGPGQQPAAMAPGQACAAASQLPPASEQPPEQGAWGNPLYDTTPRGSSGSSVNEQHVVAAAVATLAAAKAAAAAASSAPATSVDQAQSWTSGQGSDSIRGPTMPSTIAGLDMSTGQAGSVALAELPCPSTPPTPATAPTASTAGFGLPSPYGIFASTSIKPSTPGGDSVAPLSVASTLGSLVLPSPGAGTSPSVQSPANLLGPAALSSPLAKALLADPPTASQQPYNHSLASSAGPASRVTAARVAPVAGGDQPDEV